MRRRLRAESAGRFGSVPTPPDCLTSRPERKLERRQALAAGRAGLPAYFTDLLLRTPIPSR